MGFVDNIAANAPGRSGIYGQPGQGQDLDVLGIVNKLKDRELQDFKDKSNFMSDLSVKQQGKLRTMYDPNNQPIDQQTGLRHTPDGQQMGVQLGYDSKMMPQSAPMNDYQKGELGIRQQGVNLESQKLAQTGKLGQESMDIKTRQEALNKEKSDQINATKQADMQRKITESEAKIEQAQAVLESKNTNAEAQLEAHKALATAVEERHKLEMTQKQGQFDKLNEQHQELIKQSEKKLKQGSRSQTTVEQGGEKRTTTTTRGDAADTVNVMGKDGKQYTIPKDKLNDMDADGTPHWKQQEE